MSTALARRLKRLEATVGAPMLERERRIAEGRCPDCGYAHGYLPTRGGPWRCVVCGYRFTLEPGPTCMQTCPVEGNRGCNALQRPSPPDPRHARWFANRRAQHAMHDLGESLATEHLAPIQTWLQEHHRDGQPLGNPGETWYALLDRLKPPALVRAALILVGHHVDTLLSVSLTPAVAEVYLADPHAWPVNPCEGCGYLPPARAKVRPDDTYDFFDGTYLGVCPICSLDTRNSGR